MTLPAGPPASFGTAPVGPSSPEEWLAVLTRRMDLRRLTVLMLKSYVDGNAPLPEMTKETVQAWAAFQRRARTNWGELICDSVVDRVVPNGITVGGDSKSALTKAAQKIWRDNRMGSVFKEWLRYGLIYGQSYLTLWKGTGSSSPVVTADSPETMCIVTDPLQHWKPKAAIKVWRDQEAATDFAMVWTGNAAVKFRRAAYTRIEQKVLPSKWLVNLAEGAWTRDETNDSTEQLAVAPIPVVVYNNPGGHGDFETHIDLINRINAGILFRLVISSMQAFRQRIIEGGMLPEKDEHGNAIDYTKVFAPVPGALWNLPKDLTLKEMAEVDITPILSGSKEDIRQLSAVTRTPLPMLMPDNTNTSAEGAKATEAGHLFRCMDRLGEAKFGVEAAFDMALQIAGETLPDDTFTEVNFEECDRITAAEKYSAALAAHNAGESWKSIERNVLGYSPEQIAQDQIDRVAEALMLATLPPIPTVVNERLQGQAPGAAPVDNTAPNGQQPQPQSPQPTNGKPAPPTTLGGNQPGGRTLPGKR